MATETPIVDDFKDEELEEIFHEERAARGLPSLRALMKYCPQFPGPQQLMFLDITCREALFGGEAGSQKSSTLGMAAMMYNHVPGYRALLLRVNRADFFRGNQLGNRMHAWHRGTDARIDPETDAIIYPTGASIEFGHVKTNYDLDRYLSDEFSFIGFEEVTTFNLPDDVQVRNPFTWLNRSLRQEAGYPVLPRIRATTNPGGRSHKYIRRRFLTDAIENVDLEVATMDAAIEKEIRERRPRKYWMITDNRAYQHGYAEDNVHINVQSYHQGLDELDPVSRRRQKFGDWAVSDNAEISADWFRYYKRDGNQFQLLSRDSEKVIGHFNLEQCLVFMTADAAGTSKAKADAQKGNRSSYSAIGVWLKPPSHVGKCLICLHVERKRLSIPELRDRLIKMNDEWRPARIVVENEKFGQALTQLLQNRLPIKEVSTKGQDKKTRAVPLLDALEKGKVFFPRMEENWWRDYADELTTWTGLQNEVSDQVDMSAYAAQEVFMAVPPLWDPLLFGMQYRFEQLPTLNRLGVGVAPLADDSGISAVIGVGRSEGILYVDGFLEIAEPSTALGLSVAISPELFGGITPHAVYVDYEYGKLAKSKRAILRARGLPSPIVPKRLPEKTEDMERFFDSGIREGLFRYALSEGGNAICSRMAAYPNHVDEAAMKGLWLGCKALAAGSNF